jgi:drug/metabolite transporter (DMT)-like permease
MPSNLKRTDMAAIVYILCAILSFACAYLLYRGYTSSHFRLLFWTSVGFLGFAINNIMLFLDEYVIHQYDLSVIRTVPALIGMLILLYGVITETV